MLIRTHCVTFLSSVSFIKYTVILTLRLRFIIIVLTLETISTSLCASVHHYVPVLSVFGHVRCNFIFVLHIFPGVVDPSPSRPPPLLLFPCTTMSTIFSMCLYQFNLFSRIAIGYALASLCTIMVYIYRVE